MTIPAAANVTITAGLLQLIMRRFPLQDGHHQTAKRSGYDGNGSARA
jgi:hypothetical protein